MTAPRAILLVDHGDLPSWTAAALQPDPSRLVLWHPAGHGPAAGRRREAVVAHAARLAGARLILADPEPEAAADPASREQVEPGLADGLLLVRAAVAARRADCGTIIWPCQCGPDPVAAEAAMERAAIAGELVDLGGRDDPPPGLLSFDLPFVDLEERQIVDLADDAGALIDAFWPCEEGGRAPCGACGECRRWVAAVRDVGLLWPWDEVAVSGPGEGPA